MTTLEKSLDELCINTIRTLSIDGVQHANSGHPGLPLGAAPMAWVLWQRHLRHHPGNPRWADRDRFVLSAGHGSMLLYSLMHLCGYDVSLDDLKRFRQWGSKTPGHPEVHLTPGVEATTGPLGQGFANAVGMAITERMLAARFNQPGHTLVDHWTYTLVGDGDLMEGLTSEAASLAGHLKLGKLIALYDSNDISLDGPTSLSFSTEDVAARHRAYGWHVQIVVDGNHDLAGLDRALQAAKAELLKPSLILVKTTIGFGSPAKAGSADAHGSPLGPKEVEATKERLGWDPKLSFHVPDEVRGLLRASVERGAKLEAEWNARFAAYAAAHPALAAEWQRRMAGELPVDFDAGLPTWEAGAGPATREAGGKAENALAARMPELVGGDADLSVSTKTSIDKGGSFDAANGAGRNVHFGVREHAMGAIGNGMLYHGGVRPFVSTFFVFSDYMRPAVRLAALNHLPLICVWTHDSIGVGEDGPTHQPIEHLASLRAMPELDVLRPADANETAEAWRMALLQKRRPTALVLSRQKLPVLAGSKQKAREGLAKGAYVLHEPSGGAPDVVLIATGSEVSLAVDAAAALAAKSIRARVVSMPCMENFRRADAAWRESVLPAKLRARVVIEAGSSFGWREWAGDAGIVLGVDRFGASAPGEVVFEKYGFTVANVVAAAERAIAGTR
ncbi:MAG: transketolase [Planctomycetes bacterium]|nr:transketolase [Planctomycetota bacterium]